MLPACLPAPLPLIPRYNIPQKAGLSAWWPFLRHLPPHRLTDFDLCGLALQASWCSCGQPLDALHAAGRPAGQPPPIRISSPCSLPVH
jgi:hypothetical protein